MARKGFASLIGLIIMAVIFSSCLYFIYFAALQYPLTNYTLESIQARYLLEEKLHRLIMDEELFDTYLRYDILSSCRGNVPGTGKWEIRPSRESKLYENFTGGYFTQLDRGNLDRINLYLSYKYKTIKKNIEAEVSILNSFLNSGQAIIKACDLLGNELSLFDKMMDDLHKLGFTYDPRPTSSYYKYNMIDNAILKTNGSYKEFSVIREKSTSLLRKFTSDILVLYFISPYGEDLSFTIGRMNDDSLFKIRGVFYIEGDLIINQKFELEGIVIINGGRIIVNHHEAAKINGMLIYNGEDELDEDKLNVVYDKRSVIEHGSYLPIFLEPVIEVFKIR